VSQQQPLLPLDFLERLDFLLFLLLLLFLLRRLDFKFPRAPFDPQLFAERRFFLFFIMGRLAWEGAENFRLVFLFIFSHCIAPSTATFITGQPQCFFRKRRRNIKNAFDAFDLDRVFLQLRAFLSFGILNSSFERNRRFFKQKT
jgi:hypothetical protein